MLIVVMFFFFKQKTAYEMRISDWSSDVCSSDLVETIFGSLISEARADLVAGGKDDFAGLGVDDIEGALRTAPVFDDEGNLPAIFGALEDEAVIEMVEDFLARHAQCIEQAGDRQLALAVDTDVDDVLGVEFEVEPRPAIRDHARGEQEFARRVGLATVMVEEHTRRTVHLRHDDALGTRSEEQKSELQSLMR